MSEFTRSLACAFCEEALAYISNLLRVGPAALMAAKSDTERDEVSQDIANMEKRKAELEWWAEVLQQESEPKKQRKPVRRQTRKTPATSGKDMVPGPER
jgi:hypothetical protein